MRNNSVRAVAAAMSMLVLAVLACGPAGSSTTEVTEPSITITGPASGTQVMVGDDVQVVSTSVADAGVSRVELSVNGQMVRSDAPPSGNPTTFSVAQPWTPMAEGEVTISAVVYDVDGTASEPAVIVLQVEAAVAEVTSTPVPDEEGEGGCTLNAAYEADVTVPDDTEMEPGESFIKTWRIRNTGTCDWGAGFALVFVDRDQMGAPSSVPIDPTAAGETVDVAVTMVAPESPGTYRSDWRVRSDTGTTFGSIVYVRIVVPEEATATPTPTLTPTTGPTSESLVPPTNLEATFSGGHVHFTWDDAQGETAYRYEISFAAGGLGAATTGSLPADTESYDGGSVSCGGDGGFTIIAIAEGGAEIGRDSVTYETDPCPEETITIPYANRGQVDADGGTAAPSNAGDTNANNGLQGFVTFDVSDIPDWATIVSARLVAVSWDVLGDPFGGLGCLRTYAHAYGTVDASDYTPPPVTGSMHRFCSTAQIDDADYQVFNVGGISALQSALPGNQFQMRLQFNDRETDNDGVADAFRSTLQLEVTYQP